MADIPEIKADPKDRWPHQPRQNQDDSWGLMIVLTLIGVAAICFLVLSVGLKHIS